MVFWRCASLGAITVSSANRQYKDIDGVLFTKDGKTLLGYPSGRGESAYTIPEGVTAIGRDAFYECSGLTTVTIPEGVTAIGREAFSNCSGLTTVTIPKSVTTVGRNAFYECSALKPEIRADIQKRFGNSVFIY
jgi:hypothetical protein